MISVPSGIGAHISRSALFTSKNSPGVLFGAGVASMLGSTVLACRATLKMHDVLEQAQDELEVSRGLENRSPFYSESDGHKDQNAIRIKTGAKIVRLYAPAIVVGGVGIAALTRSHQILNARNAGLTAAYATLEKGFSEYRKRVVDKYGEEEDQHLRYGTREERALIDGKEKTVTRVALTAGSSIYARFFDEACPSWDPVPEYNLSFIKCQQNWANDRLHARGHVFLNEVYDSLGIERSQAGAVVGWILSKNGSTDNFIDFGVFNVNSPKARDFVNGREGAILLDFNVDGPIHGFLPN